MLIHLNNDIKEIKSYQLNLWNWACDIINPGSQYSFIHSFRKYLLSTSSASANVLASAVNKREKKYLYSKINTINIIDYMLNGDKYIEGICTMHILMWHFKISFNLKYFLNVHVIFFLINELFKSELLNFQTV